MLPVPPRQDASSPAERSRHANVDKQRTCRWRTPPGTSKQSQTIPDSDGSTDGQLHEDPERPKFLNRSAGHGGQTAHRPRCALSSCSAVILHTCGRRSRHQAGPPESAGFEHVRSTLLAAVSGRRSRAAGPSPCITVHYPALAHGVVTGGGVVEQARKDGYTETILGRRRYLTAPAPDRPRTPSTRREMAERMALNAPIQGSAAQTWRPSRSRRARRRARWIGQTAVVRQINRTSADRGQGDNLSASREINSPPRGKSARPLTAWSAVPGHRRHHPLGMMCRDRIRPSLIEANPPGQAR